MSYSYIKSVFPNFETSNVYDERIYNDLSSSNNTLMTTPKDVETKFPMAYQEDMNQFAKKLIESEPEFIPVQTKLEEYKNSVEHFEQPQKPEQKWHNYGGGTKDNLRFYNLPIDNTIQRTGIREGFEQDETNKCNVRCDDYVKHILDCSRCKAIVTKQLNLETDKIRNEEIMEVISYMVFGIFILLLIDNLRSK